MEDYSIKTQYKKMRDKVLGDNINYDPIPLGNLLEKIDSGELIIPDFQRDFVWDFNRFIMLFDSIYKDYTIGSLLLWDTNEKLAYRKVGGKKTFDVENLKNNQFVYVLDGQQRLTALYSVLRGKAIYKHKLKNPKYFSIFFDTEKSCFLKGTEKINSKTVCEFVNSGFDVNLRFINLADLFSSKDNSEFPSSIIDPLSKKNLSDYEADNVTKDEYIKINHFLDQKKEEFKNFRYIFENYKIPRYVHKGNDLDKIVTIFERINTQNLILSIFDIMVAKTYKNIKYDNDNYTFNLKETCKKILYKNDLDSKYLIPKNLIPDQDSYLYYNISNTTLLRLISIMLESNENKIALLKEDIFNLKPQKIYDSLKLIRSNIARIKNYLSSNLNVECIDERIVNNNILSFLTYIYSKTDPKKIDSVKIINQWFWNTTLFNRYSGAQLQQIESDVKKYNENLNSFKNRIIEKRNLNLLNKDFSISGHYFLNAGYDIRSTLYHALILLLNFQKPIDFDGSRIKINISQYFGSSYKNNKHHIIPYNSSAGKDIRNLDNGNKIINNIANIMIISSDLNKEISNKIPKDYFEKCESKENFYEILESHLIDKDMYEDLKNEKYIDFLNKRTKRIITEIKKVCLIDNEVLDIITKVE